jgi:hypothetical protein
MTAHGQRRLDSDHHPTAPFPTPLEECIRRTTTHFRKLKAKNMLHDRDL